MATQHHGNNEPPASQPASRDSSHFDRIAERYCRKDLQPASRLARAHRLARTLCHVPLDNGLRLLEVGCGAGFAARSLAGCYKQYCGVDAAAELIRLARHYQHGPGIELHTADIRDFTSAQPFDAALMIGVLHHLEAPAADLCHIVSLLRPGGWLIANEPQPANPLIRWARSLRKRLDPAYAAEQTELSAAQLHQLLHQAGLVNLSLHPQGLLSTTFAEVVLPPQWLTRHLATVACRIDTLLERHHPGALSHLSFNLVAVGQRHS